MVIGACSLNTWEAQPGGSLHLTGQMCSLMSELQVSERLCLKKRGIDDIPENYAKIVLWLHIFKSTHDSHIHANVKV